MPDSLPPNAVRTHSTSPLATDDDRPWLPVAGIVTRATMLQVAPSIAPLVGEARTAADSLQAALESGEPAAVTAALDQLVDLGQSAFRRLVRL